MPNTDDLPAITRLYQVCEPLESLHPTDPRWVDFDDVRGDENVVQLYARSLRRALPGRADFKLFTGHRGVGKTSELFRLKALLEEPAGGGKGFVVVYCDVSDRLDVNDLDFPDLLVFVAAQLQEQLGRKGLPGFDPVTTYLKRVWDDIRGLLGAQVELEKVEVDAGFGKLATELRNRPSSRGLLRDAVEKHSTSLLDAVNDLLSSAQVSARTAGHTGLVLIIDGLDKLVRRDLGNGNNTHDRLFIDRSEQLASLQTHTVYTVPISLIYSPRFGQLQQT
ncbi:MAG: AAA family ATPase, partial [Chromatiaceae bacterium]|nr:AAA family ATPase [Chromatiaceae bacterium]